jgi:hypothetical protein
LPGQKQTYQLAPRRTNDGQPVLRYLPFSCSDAAHFAHARESFCVVFPYLLRYIT